MPGKKMSDELVFLRWSSKTSATSPACLPNQRMLPPASASWTVGWRLEGIPKESQSCEPDRVDSCWHIHFKPASQLDRVS